VPHRSGQLGGAFVGGGGGGGGTNYYKIRRVEGIVKVESFSYFIRGGGDVQTTYFFNFAFKFVFKMPLEHELEFKIFSSMEKT
jgi:hypothetical protein